jgi:hypothetical protein
MNQARNPSKRIEDLARHLDWGFFRGFKIDSDFIKFKTQEAIRIL